MKGRLLIPLLLVILAGCVKTPDEVRESLAGNTESLRMVKRDLVQSMPDGEAKVLWLGRLNAFIVRSRALQAWADDRDEFDTAQAMKEESERMER